MNELKAAKAEIIDILASVGINCFDHMPGRLAPPVAFLQAGNPYMSWDFNGVTFNTFEVSFDLTLLIATGSNSTMIDEMNELIEKAVKALLEEKWTMLSVSSLYAHSQNNAVYLAADIKLSDIRKFED